MRILWRTVWMVLLMGLVTLQAEMIGEVVFAKGNVKVKHEGSIKKKRLHVGDKIFSGDTVSTTKNSFAKFVLVDKSRVILDENSIIHFKGLQEISQNAGRVYYKITSRGAKSKLKVRTNFAIIGIKGTTFIVKASDSSKEVLLKEGLVGIASVKAEFELYVKKVNAEFEAFKQQQQRDFEAYKSQFGGYAAPVKTKEFDLQQARKVSFDDNKVFQDPFKKDDTKEFEYFEKILNEEF